MQTHSYHFQALFGKWRIFQWTEDSKHCPCPHKRWQTWYKRLQTRFRLLIPRQNFELLLRGGIQTHYPTLNVDSTLETWILTPHPLLTSTRGTKNCLKIHESNMTIWNHLTKGNFLFHMKHLILQYKPCKNQNCCPKTNIFWL